MARTRTASSDPAPSAAAVQPNRPKKRRQRSTSIPTQEPAAKRTQTSSAPPSNDLSTELESTVNEAEVPAPFRIFEDDKAQQASSPEKEDAPSRRRRVRFSEINDGIPSPPDTQETQDSDEQQPQQPQQPQQLNTAPTEDNDEDLIRLSSSSPTKTLDSTPHPTHSARHARRASLTPSTTAVVRSSPIGLVEEVTYIPLRQALDARSRRRLRRSHLSEEINDLETHEREDRRTRHALDSARHELEEKDRRLHELEWELESQRQLGIDVYGSGGGDDDEHEESEQVREMREQIRKLKEEIQEQRERQADEGIRDVDMEDDTPPDDDGLQLIAPEDIGFGEPLSSPTPDLRFNGHATMRGMSFTMPKRNMISSEASTQVALPDPTHELEITQFEREITHLTRQVADKEAALKLLVIELQSLGFTTPDETLDTILPRIRETFAIFRTDLDQLLPQLNARKYHNGELLHAIVPTLKEVMMQIAEHGKTLDKLKEMNVILSRQNDGLLEKLSETDERKKRLTQRWMDLDKDSEQKTKRIVELQELLTTAEDHLDNRDEVIADRDATVTKLENENGELSGTISRLQTALTGYRDEISALEQLITRMEADHKTEIERLTDDHRGAVQSLQDKLDESTSHLRIAETDLDAKTALISKLERRIESAETELDNLEVQLATAQDDFVRERTSREELEGDLEDRRAEIDVLTNRVGSLETSLDALREELQVLRDRADTERSQREAAEVETDRLNSRIAELEKKIQDEGIRGNELRQKLFEVQQQRDQQVQELQAEAEQREEEFQQDMSEEVERRQASEQSLRARSVHIAELETKIRELDDTLDALLQEKNELIAHQDEQIKNLTADYEASQQEFADLTDKKTAEIESLHSDIVNLTSQLAGAHEEIALRHDEARAASAAHQTALASRDDAIATLTAENSDAAAQIASLEDENASLSRRVEAEATAMLELSNQFADEQSKARTTIADRAATIKALQSELADVQAQRDTGFTARDLEIESLRDVAEKRELQIETLSKQLLDVKARFRAEVDASRMALGAILDPVRMALGQAEVEAKARDAQAVAELNALESVVDVVAGAEAEERRLLNGYGVKMDEKIKIGDKGRISKKGRKRLYDSGIGVEEDEDDELALEAY